MYVFTFRLDSHKFCQFSVVGFYTYSASLGVLKPCDYTRNYEFYRDEKSIDKHTKKKK